jgi:hypothetical protein
LIGLVTSGVDPLEERQQKREAKAGEATIGTEIERYLAKRKTYSQHKSFLTMHCKPLLAWGRLIEGASPSYSMKLKAGGRIAGRQRIISTKVRITCPEHMRFWPDVPFESKAEFPLRHLMSALPPKVDIGAASYNRVGKASRFNHQA